MVGGHHVREEVAKHRNETPSLVAFRPSRVSMPTPCGRVSLQKQSGRDFKGFSEHSLVLLKVAKLEKLCDGGLPQDASANRKVDDK